MPTLSLDRLLANLQAEGFGVAEIYKVVFNVSQALHREADLFALL